MIQDRSLVANRNLYAIYQMVLFSMTLSDLKWLSEIFNDMMMKHRAVSLRQLSFLFWNTSRNKNSNLVYKFQTEHKKLQTTRQVPHAGHIACKTELRYVNWFKCIRTCTRLQRSADCNNRKQLDHDHVTSPGRRSERERELEHDNTGYHSLPRSTPVDARPAAAVENETSAGNLSRRYSGVSPTTRRHSVDKFTYVTRRNDVGNHRHSSSRPNYR